MNSTFTKLFSTITDSTIWCEDSETRIVWITMLAMSDKNGHVSASVPGLANRSQVSLVNVEKALYKFKQPDKYSRTTDNEGRRIKSVDGGWILLNHAKYRAIRNSEARKEYKRNWIKDKRKEDKKVDNVDQGRPQYTNTDTYTDKHKDQNPLSKKFDEEDLITAKFIFSSIQSINPAHKKPNLESWANDVRLMREIDNHSHVEIRDLYEWVNNDHFWKSNILSPKKLRAKWDQLIIKKQSENDNGKNKRSYETSGERVSRINREAFEKAAAEEGLVQNLDNGII